MCLPVYLTTAATALRGLRFPPRGGCHIRQIHRYIIKPHSTIPPFTQ
jgi:hypothetical protein